MVAIYKERGFLGWMMGGVFGWELLGPRRVKGEGEGGERERKKREKKEEAKIEILFRSVDVLSGGFSWSKGGEGKGKEKEEARGGGCED